MEKVSLAIMVVISLSLLFSCSRGTPPMATTLPETSPANELTANVPLVPPVALGTPGFVAPSGPVSVYSVKIDLVPSKQVYMPGEEVDMELVLTNASQGEAEPVIVSPAPPAVSLYPPGSAPGPAMPPGLTPPGTGPGQTVKAFPAGSGETTLAMGEKLTYHLTWDQKDGNGNQVPPGWYYYNYTCWFRPESSTEPSGSGGSNRAFLIQYPQGAMQKTIEVNESRTVSGVSLMIGGETKPVDVTITLERVVLDQNGATFYAMMRAPGNPVSADDTSLWVSSVPMSAQYVVDDVTREARAPSVNFLDSRVEMRWGASADDPNYLDPVPSDANKMTFIIPTIGQGQAGPLEFEIPLD
jgi:hypothetical protein